MNLSKAIELLSDQANSPRYIYDPDMKDALKLGIEALKLIDKDHHSAVPWFEDLLPGETEG